MQDDQPGVVRVVRDLRVFPSAADLERAVAKLLGEDLCGAGAGLRDADLGLGLLDEPDQRCLGGESVAADVGV
jgi:hypothetical protein